MTRHTRCFDDLVGFARDILHITPLVRSSVEYNRYSLFRSCLRKNVTEGGRQRPATGCVSNLSEKTGFLAINNVTLVRYPSRHRHGVARILAFDRLQPPHTRPWVSGKSSDSVNLLQIRQYTIVGQTDIFGKENSFWSTSLNTNGRVSEQQWIRQYCCCSGPRRSSEQCCLRSVLFDIAPILRQGPSDHPGNMAGGNGNEAYLLAPI